MMTKNTTDKLYTIGFGAMIVFGLYMFLRPPVIEAIDEHTFAVSKTSSLYDRNDIEKLANDYCADSDKTASITKYEKSSSGSGKFQGANYSIIFVCE